MRRGIMLTETAFWDVSVDVYMQIKERLERYRCEENGQYIMERDIENPVAYIYFAVPKRFCAMISKKKTNDDIFRNQINLDKISEFVPAKRSIEDEIEDIDNSRIQEIVSEYLGEATTNKELKARKQKIRGAGYAVKETTTGYEVEVLQLSPKEIEKIRKVMETNITIKSPIKLQQHKEQMLKHLTKEEEKWKQPKRAQSKKT